MVGSNGGREESRKWWVAGDREAREKREKDERKRRRKRRGTDGALLERLVEEGDLSEKNGGKLRGSWRRMGDGVKGIRDFGKE